MKPRTIVRELRKLTKERHTQLFGQLSEEERGAVAMRHGFGDGHLYSMEDVANVFRCSVEGAEHYYSEAMRKLGDLLQGQTRK